jgi:hypothetical protein
MRTVRRGLLALVLRWSAPRRNARAAAAELGAVSGGVFSANGQDAFDGAEAGGWPKRSRAAVGSCVGQFDLPGCDCGLGRRCWSPEKILAAAALEALRK